MTDNDDILTKEGVREMTKAEAKRDLKFLQEMKQRLESGDPSQELFAMEMINDWIDELKKRLIP